MAIRFWEGDVVYYDKDSGVLEVPLEGLRSTGAAGGVELSARRPPEKFVELGDLVFACGYCLSHPPAFTCAYRLSGGHFEPDADLLDHLVRHRGELSSLGRITQLDARRLLPTLRQRLVDDRNPLIDLVGCHR